MNLDLCDQKVALAVQTYETVDKHIRQLDSDLKRFEAETTEQSPPRGLSKGRCRDLFPWNPLVLTQQG